MRCGLAILALALVACGGAGAPAPGLSFSDAAATDVGGAADAPEVGGPDGVAEPGYVDADPLLAAHLQGLLDEYLAFSGEQNVSLTVLLPEQVRWRGVAGVQDLLTGAPMPPGAAFRVGSSTKPVISALALLLQEAGILSLDDPLGMYVPDYPQWSDVTLRQLLSMRSGIADYLIDQTLWLEIVQHPEQPMSAERLLGYVSGLPLQFAPGSECLYSNTNYLLMGLVIEAATGRSVAREIAERIVAPLGLEHTYLDVDAAPDEWLAHGYMDPRPAFAALGVPPHLVGLIPEELFVSDDMLDCAYLFHPSVAGAAGALVTTTEDLARFLRAFFEGELVSEASLAQVMDFPNCVILGEPADYGLGMSRYETPDGEGFGHGGLIYGYTANSAHVPEVGLTYSHMHGAYPAQHWGLISEIHRLVAAPPPEVPPPCLPPEGFFAGEGERLEARLRGPLNGPEAAAPLGAITNFTAWLGGERYPVYGTVTSANLEGEEGARRVSAFSLGPPRQAGWDYSFGMLGFDTGLLGTQMSPEGLWESRTDSYAVLAVVADMATDPQTGAMESYCVAAVPAKGATARLSVCEPESVSWEEGALARFFVELPLSRDTAAIEAYLRPLGLGRCNCLVAPETWAPCEAPRKAAERAPRAPLRDLGRPPAGLGAFPRLRPPPGA